MNNHGTEYEGLMGYIPGFEVDCVTKLSGNFFSIFSLLCSILYGKAFDEML